MLTLTAAGAVARAVCGVLVLAPAWIAARLHPTPDDVFVVWSDIVPVAATVGSMVGAVSGPTLALSLLRRAPLWRVVSEPLLGAIIGSVIGWALIYTRLGPGLEALAIGGLLGALCAALRLRWTAHRRQGDILGPAT